ncbi:MAG: capsular biosynthesis protein [Kordiimonadaceae bacterium]|nr:capsular biosynthesis protein [Kordiimonadaceae bacterium]
MPGKKTPSYLLLQGLASPFFSLLATKLHQSGASAHKVNFCGGDQWFARKHPGKHLLTQTNYTGTQTALAAEYRHLIKTHSITAIILLGDCRPIHKIARSVAIEQKLDVIVFEEGYTRTGWITCELTGTNDNSILPRTATAITERARMIAAHSLQQPPQEQPPLPNAMPARVRMDLQFHAANILGAFKFRHYQTHRPEKVTAELKGWAARFLRKFQYKSVNNNQVAHFEKTTQPFFLVPLQLTSDFQIREHSDYASVADFIEEIIASFAADANTNHALLFKSHPLDNGMVHYRALIAAAAKAHGIADRVSYIEGGDLDKLLIAAKGIALINSTVGFAALKHRKPLKVMGRMLYDIDDLTHQGPLGDFWQAPPAPDTDLTTDFLAVVRADSQIYGDFFTDLGMEMAATTAAKRLLAGPNWAESEPSK